jgi:hypothetical protein
MMPDRPLRLLDRIGDALFDVGYGIEHAAVLCLEGIRRTINRLDPRIYSTRRRVLDVSDGSANHNRGKTAVLLIFCPGAIPAFTRNMIAALARRQFDLLVVSNSPLLQESRNYLLANCRWLMLRRNVGRDFGGYKDGVEFLLAQTPLARTMLVANDSIFYLEQGLDDLIARLDAGADFAGISEVYEHHYHVASFLMSFGEKAIRHESFRRFWRRYLPLSTRRWAIFRGEGDLTADLIGAGFSPTVIYRAQDLQPVLRRILPEALEGTLAKLASFSQRELRERWAKAGKDAPSAAAHDEAAVVLADDIVANIILHNEMHAAGRLFRHHFGMPVMKRDIFYREVYPMTELDAVVGEIDASLQAEVRADLVRRGDPAKLPLLRRILHRHSAI